ncbi:MAG: hypothetical protein IKL55_02390 [Clostridia bacterium]|nr:hypothetical protein [Clostridia bacterium]
MKIEINLKMIFALIFIFMFNNINTYLIFLFFILIHELAHLLIGICIGGIPNKMTLSLFGASIEFYSYGKNKIIGKLLFFSIGPITNFIIGIMCNEFMKESEMKNLIVITNFAIGSFNMIPILPLDGGKILKEILILLFGFENSNKISMFVSKSILIIASLSYSILILKIHNIVILFLLIYLWYLYYIEEKKYTLYLKTKGAIKNIM